MFNQQLIEHYREVAAKVLVMCKDINPRFPNPENNPNMANAWATVFSRYPVPAGAYFEAVVDFFAHDTEGEIPTAGQIVKHCRQVVARWESEPARRQQLTQWREARRDARDAAIAAGTFRGALAAPSSEPVADLSAAGFMAILESKRV